MRKAVYAGTFDPITNGHLDIIERSLSLFDEIHVVIFYNPYKKTAFSLEERLEMIRRATSHLKGVVVDSSDDLAVEYARKIGASALVRGLRATQDYQYESQLAYTNQYLAEDIETVFLMTRLSQMFISSSSVKEIASHKGDVSALVPAYVNEKIVNKYGK